MSRAEDDDGDVAPAVKVRGRALQWAQFGISLAVLAVLFGWALPRYVDYGEVWAAVARLTAGEVIVLALLGLTWTLVDSIVFTSVIPGLRFLAGYRAWLASNAVAAFAPSPVDLAVRYAVYASYGLGRRVVASGVMLSGVLTSAVKLGAALFALVAIAVRGVADGVMLAAGAAVTILVVVLAVRALRSDTVVAAVGHAVERAYNAVIARRITHRPVRRLDRWALDFRTLLFETLADRWRIAVPAAVLAELILFAALLASARFLDISPTDVPVGDLLTAFALGLAATLLPVLRSGLGASELIYLVVLSDRASGLADDIAAAAFTQRVFTWLLPVVIGLVVLLDLVRRYGRRGRRGG